MIKINIEIIKNKILELQNKLNIKNKIELMAVTKTRSENEILEAINAGQKLFGENRIQEAYKKFNSDLLKNQDITLHIIGHLQRNKIKEAAEIAEMIQSIDKIETLEILEKFVKCSIKKWIT